MGRDMEVAAGRVQAPMAQQELDASQIDPRFEHMRREAVSQHMRVNRLAQFLALCSRWHWFSLMGKILPFITNTYTINPLKSVPLTHAKH